MPGARHQRGFTALELAAILVITGLLLGATLKAQELINAARVRSLLSQQDGIKAAYFGFFDQYRALPGDYSQAAATIPGVSGCSGNGNGNGRIDDGTATPASEEHILVWEHLSRAGYITGQYTCSSPESVSTTPTSPFGVRMRLAWDNRYAAPGPPAPTARHNLKTGGQIPSDILAEIDRKIDDGSAIGGTFRFSDYDAGTGAPDPASCYLAGANGQWKGDPAGSNCGATNLL